MTRPVRKGAVMPVVDFSVAWALTLTVLPAPELPAGNEMATCTELGVTPRRRPTRSLTVQSIGFVSAAHDGSLWLTDALRAPALTPLRNAVNDSKENPKSIMANRSRQKTGTTTTNSTNEAPRS